MKICNNNASSGGQISQAVHFKWVKMHAGRKSLAAFIKFCKNVCRVIEQKQVSESLIIIYLSKPTEWEGL